MAAQVGCAPAAAPPLTPPAPAAGDGATKTLVLAQANPMTALGPWWAGNTTGGGSALMGVHSTGLVSLDSQGNEVGQVAVALPSLTDGSIVLLPDGRMRTIWRLRPNVTWQDGTPFAAEDVAFSHQVLTDPLLPSPGGQNVTLNIERVEVVDSSTVSMTWKSTYYNARFLDYRSFWLLPRHLLAKAYEEGNKDTFLSKPYFTTDYVNLGPFRLVDWGLGQQLTLERYTDYFLGTPRLGRMIIQAIPDQNVIAAGLRAGTIDLVPEKAMGAPLNLALRDEWQASGEGTILSRQVNWYYLQLQWNPQWAQPAEVPRDVRLRVGLYEAIDRAALRAFMFPGVPDTNADTFVGSGDSRGPVVGQPFARYTYDPARAARDLTEAGWSRTPDGHFLDRSGNPVQLQIRTTPADASPMAIIAADWRKLGLGADENIIPPQRLFSGQEASQFPGGYITGWGLAETTFPRFDSRQIPTAETRWIGANQASYANPTLDRLINQLYGTLDFNERGGLLNQMGVLLAEDLPALPLYWQIGFLALRNTVRGPVANDFQHLPQDISGGGLARNAHLWERA